MSSANASFPVTRPFAQVVDICGRAAAAAGWKKVQVTPAPQPNVAVVTGKESFSFFSFHYPAYLRCVVQATSESQCMVTVTSSNFGYGPIQSGYVKKRLDEAVRAIVSAQAV